MNDIIINIGAFLISVIIGSVLLVYIFKSRKIFDIDKKREHSEQILAKSKQEAQKILNETRTQADNHKKQFKIDVQKREQRIKKIKSLLAQKEDQIKKRQSRINENKLKIASFGEEVQSKQEAIKRIEKEIIEKLSLKTGKAKSDLIEQTIERYKKELKEDNVKKIVELEEDIKDKAARKARSILVNTIQRLSSPTSVESRVILIKVPKDPIKGKIVGKDGENIRTFEELLDVAVVFNDLPNTISITGYNLVIRRIAEIAMKKLIKIRGGIDPNVVKKTIEKAKKEIEDELFIRGKKALEKMGIKNANKDFTRVVGRLQYRTSFGQNIMKHSMEVAWVSVMLGSELGLDSEMLKVAGFLHDLGKAIDQDPNIKDGHDYLTKELMEKYGFGEKEIHAAWAHHDAVEQETPEALIIKAADAVSGGRPGARQDSLERYMERIQGIDDTVKSFDGVKKSYAMSAGREVRVYVDPEKITDTHMEDMANGIAHKLEENVFYPGKIKVKVIRRTKALEIAK